MMTQKKLYGGRNCEMTKLKAKWRELPEDERARWRELFISPKHTQAELRAMILEEFKIDLRHNSQINQLRKWEEEQRERDLEGERQAEDERRIVEQYPHWTLEQARELVLNKCYQRAIRTGDFTLALRTGRLHLNAKAVQLHREKFEFDAAEQCLKKREELNAIQEDATLTTPEKLDQIRMHLFGRVAEDSPALMIQEENQ